MKKYIYTFLTLLLCSSVYGQTQIENSPIYYQNGNTIIGVQNIPTSKLEIFSTATMGTLFNPLNATLNLTNGSINLLLDPNEIYSNSDLHIGSDRAKKIYFKGVDATGSTTRMLINSNGYVGIGTTNPLSILHINAGETGDAILRLEADTDNSGNEDDNPRIEMYQDGGMVYAHLGFNEDTPTAQNIFQFSFGSPEGFKRGVLNINPHNGKIGLGVLNPSEKLVVDGTILAEEVKVQNVPQSDYVFEPDYNLLPLTEVETFIKENKHLPEIPSAEEFKENGVGLGEMDDMLLRKVEELTLYIIQQNKELEQQDAQLEQQSTEIAFLKEQNEKLNILLEQNENQDLLIGQLLTEIEKLKNNED